MVASVLGIFAPLASVEIDLKKKKKPKRREIEMAAKYIPVCTEACCPSRTRVPDRRMCSLPVLAAPPDTG